jgi:hypothetical protein
MNESRVLSICLLLVLNKNPTKIQRIFTELPVTLQEEIICKQNPQTRNFEELLQLSYQRNNSR